MTKTITNIQTVAIADSAFRGSPYEIPETAGASTYMVSCGADLSSVRSETVSGTVIDVPMVPAWLAPNSSDV